MSNGIVFDYTNTKPFMKDHELDQMEPFIAIGHELIHKRGDGWLGWVDLPINYPKDEFQKVKKIANRIRSDSDALIVIGIGGSYLGARAVIEMLTHPFYNQLPKSKRSGPEIYFVGHHLCSDYIHGLVELLAEKEVSVNVISKSGTTTEPAISFRIIREFMKKKYGESSKNRIFATTDKKGALKRLADEEGYETFTIPDDIGGRYSVLTPVGLLPIAVAGIDIDAMMNGAQGASEAYSTSRLMGNDCYLYAAIRNILYRKGRGIELLANYQPSLVCFSEWWKQLYGESEGKDGKGIFPASANFTTDLHSMGQYIQEGPRIFFETVLFVEHPRNSILLQKEPQNLDGLNYLEGKTIDVVNSIAFQGTLKAHVDGDVPISVLKVNELSPRLCGELIYFFQKACALSGYLLGVNPFDQPGVEVYKKNMFALLGKSRDTLHIY